MDRFLTPGVLGGLLAIASASATAAGKPALGVFLSDPQTAATVSTVLTGILALAAGLAPGLKPKA
jgi:uncharacterized protein (DUF3084 family)